MGQLLIACETLKDEIQKVMDLHQLEIPVHWMGNSLHAAPDRLREALQEVLNTITDLDQVLLGYGNCGNGLVGISCPGAAMVIPRFGDCIDMLLSGNPKLDEIRSDTYFLTRGWLRGESPVTKDLSYQLKRYGKEQSKKIMQVLFKNYTYMMMIQTGSYDISDVQEELDAFSALTELELIEGEGSLTILEQLLTGHWAENFCVIPPGQPTTLEDFKALNL
ncbi:DUF1638 domain-containing protein [Eubacterium sp. 1001713B170207_170306_E7]|uniref:DUF1638 domain-containing protein n=1 Tax=Eubacterium sp. 1001713B170207_170306_E7 TaxID=2787097 RepID=UPI00189A3D25|nr:DUF1638 domain-containing protein [Eubacterium sp. 1001713B170207_170306_E7]